MQSKDLRAIATRFPKRRDLQSVTVGPEGLSYCLDDGYVSILVPELCSADGTASVSAGNLAAWLSEAEGEVKLRGTELVSDGPEGHPPLRLSPRPHGDWADFMPEETGDFEAAGFDAALRVARLAAFAGRNRPGISCLWLQTDLPFGPVFWASDRKQWGAVRATGEGEGSLCVPRSLFKLLQRFPPQRLTVGPDGQGRLWCGPLQVRIWGQFPPPDCSRVPPMVTEGVKVQRGLLLAAADAGGPGRLEVLCSGQKVTVLGAKGPIELEAEGITCPASRWPQAGEIMPSCTREFAFTVKGQLLQRACRALTTETVYVFAPQGLNRVTLAEATMEALYVIGALEWSLRP